MSRAINQATRTEGVELRLADAVQGLAFACYQGTPGGSAFRLGALNVLTLRGGRIAALTAFLDPTLYDQFGLPRELPA